MYVQLQKKVREHVIEVFNQISDSWVFDIDTNNVDNPVIVGIGPDGLVIRTPIELFHKYITDDWADGMKELYEISCRDSKVWSGCMMLRGLFDKVFEIYGINTYHPYYLHSDIAIKNRNNTKTINSCIYGIFENGYDSMYFISPFVDVKFQKYVAKEQLVSPLLLLLDPITYFRRYSVIIKKYKELDCGHTLGIYEILLEYFPEMNEELVGKYLLLWSVFQELCPDISLLVGEVLVGLYC